MIKTQYIIPNTVTGPCSWSLGNEGKWILCENIFKISSSCQGGWWHCDKDRRKTVLLAIWGNQGSGDSWVKLDTGRTIKTTRQGRMKTEPKQEATNYQNIIGSNSKVNYYTETNYTVQKGHWGNSGSINSD